MIKKLIIATGVVLAAVATYSGISWWSGFRIQSQSYAAMDAINLHLARTGSDQVRLSARGYHRGIFSSEASYVLSFPASKDGPALPKRELLFINHITHGPFPLQNILNGEFSAIGAFIHTVSAPTPWTDGLFKVNQGQALVVGETRVSTNGMATLDWSIQPIDVRHDALRVKFAGAKLKADIGPRLINRKGELVLDALNITDGHTTFDVKGVKVKMDTRLDASGLSIGTHTREIGSLSWASVNASTIELDKFKLRTEMKLEDAEVTGSTDLTVGALSIAQQKFGALKLSLTYDKLSDRALGPLLELYHRATAGFAINILKPEPLSTAEIKKAWQHLHRLLKNDPSIRIEPLAWETSAGKSQLTLHTTFKPAELASGGIGLRENLIDTLDATLTISQPMVNALVLQHFQKPGTPAAKIKNLADRESRRLAEMAVQLKLGRVQNGRLVSHFNVQDGELRINGQRSAPEPLLKLLSSLVPMRFFASQPQSGQEGPDEALSLQHLDPRVLGAILSDSDFAYQETRDEDGDLVLKVAPGDAGANSIEIIFSGCRKDPTCEDVLLRATYSSAQTAPLKFINDWNLRNRWARVYLKDSGAPVLEMDISAYGGIGQDAIESMVSTFFKLVRDFSKELNATEKAGSVTPTPAAQ
jgi:uncharacterized protein YdgA (DUF945 family)